MIKHLFKLIWNERRRNVWLLLELSIVFFFFLVLSDFLWIKLKNYMEPVGFDIEETFVLRLKRLEPSASIYVDPALHDLTPLDELQQLVANIEQHVLVDRVSLSVFTLPYSMGGYWRSVFSDSTNVSNNQRIRLVTTAYFDVFRIRSYTGEPIRFEEGSHRQVIMTEDIARKLFDSPDQAIGQDVYYDGEEAEASARVVAVSTKFKRQDFYPYESTLFELVTPGDLNNRASVGEVSAIDLCLRVKPGSAMRFRDRFQDEMGDRLRVNNLYVSSIAPSSELKDKEVGRMWRVEVLPMLYVFLFVVITVFLGVFGTFFLRTRQRFAEIGIRMALGADRATIRFYLLLEGLCFVVLAFLPGLIVYLNLLRAEVLNVYYLPISLSRIAIAFGTSLLVLAVMVLCGILWPASRAASIEPVEALRDE